MWMMMETLRPDEVFKVQYKRQRRCQRLHRTTMRSQSTGITVLWRTATFLLVVVVVVVVSATATPHTDTVGGSVSTSSGMNVNSATNSNDENHDICHDMYMTMYMDGFHWSLLFKSSATSAPICLNYFVATWKVQSPNEFRGCMIYTFLLAIVVEAISSIRNICVQYFNKATTTTTTAGTSSYRSWSLTVRPSLLYLKLLVRDGIIVILYAIQTIVGYLLMLVAMSYSVELLLSIFFGLCMGNILFVRYDEGGTSTNNSRDDEFDGENDDDDTKDEGSMYDDIHNYSDEEQTTTTRPTSTTLNQHDETQSLLSNRSIVFSNSKNDGTVRRRG